MSIYTKTGDAGETGLFGNKRVRKHDPRIEAYGTVDELNSALGIVAAMAGAELRTQLEQIQSTLFDVGADLATEGGDRSVPRVAEHTRQLEGWIDAAETQLPGLRSFILPGGTALAAQLHLARTVCRRAERRVWELADAVPSVPKAHPVYLNRLSDLLFVWARQANHSAGVADVPWVAAKAGPRG